MQPLLRSMAVMPPCISRSGRACGGWSNIRKLMPPLLWLVIWTRFAFARIPPTTAPYAKWRDGPQAIGLVPHFPSPYFVIGNALLKKGLVAEGLGSFKKRLPLILAVIPTGVKSIP